MTTPCPCISYFCIPLSIFVSTPSLSLFFCLSLSYIAIFLYFCNYITFILSICLSLSLFLLYPTGHSIFLWCLGSFQILYIFQPIGRTQHPLFMVIDISTSLTAKHLAFQINHICICLNFMNCTELPAETYVYL